jgi:hypothetical protein
MPFTRTLKSIGQNVIHFRKEGGLIVVLPFMPRYIGTLNVTHRDFTSLDESISTELTPPTGTTPLPNSPPSLSLPPRLTPPLPEVQIDKNRHVLKSPSTLTLDHPQMAPRKKSQHKSPHLTHQTHPPSQRRPQRHNNKLQTPRTSPAGSLRPTKTSPSRHRPAQSRQSTSL